MLLSRREQLRSADHQTHRRYLFAVPSGCTQLSIHVAYDPKFVSRTASADLVQQAVTAQVHSLTERVGSELAEGWAVGLREAELIVPNLLTISLDDPIGAYRGAAHRHPSDQTLTLGFNEASPGLMPGPLPAGEWSLTLSIHTLVSAQCEVEIQIGALIADSSP